MVKRKKSYRKKRPIAVSIIATAIVVLFLVRLYQVVVPLIQQQVFINGISSPLFVDGSLTPLCMAIITSAVYLILSVLGIIVLVGFLKVRRWSWVVLMAWTGVSLTISLIDYFYRRPNYIVMVSNVIIAFALNQADIQRIFGIRSEEGETSF
jgi:predicted membrane channel-forming protein YqfA (hemolysin III family)